MTLSDRMKEYESFAANKLHRHMPVIIRVDGRAFHSFTKGMKRPFDDSLIKMMKKTGLALAKNIDGVRLVYGQSDEISILLDIEDPQRTMPWFGYKLYKMLSISSSIATAAFAKALMESEYSDRDFPHFDSRAFNIPKEEVVNYFIWRQQDAVRNSIQMVGQSFFSHGQLQNKSCDDIQEMLFTERNINWNAFPVDKKRGWCVLRKKKHQSFEELKEKGNIPEKHIPKGGVVRRVVELDEKIPIFTKDRGYVYPENGAG